MSKQERAIATREAILLAAAIEFDEYGFDGARVDRMSATSGISKGAMYFHFDSKLALARALVEDKYSNWPVLIAEVNACGLRGFDAASELCRRVGATLVADVRVRAGMALSQTVPSLAPKENPYWRWAQIVAALLREDQVRSRLRPNIDPETIALVAVDSFFGAFMIARETGTLIDLDHHIERLWAVLNFTTSDGIPVTAEITV